MITVANVRDFLVPNMASGGKCTAFPDETYVWVGRMLPRWGLRASPLRNPFRVGKPPWNGASFLLTQADAVSLYRMHFRDRGASEEEELARLRALHEKHGKLVLVCACHPKPCHASVIKEVLEAGA